MAVFTCKMCGATLDVEEGKNVATCNYCGTAQTLPQQRGDVITNLFNRANKLRLKAEFDKAQQLYEKLIADDVKDSEAHWGIVLCKYGIEYVDDSKTQARIPTCHRTQVESVLADIDYQEAISLCDEEQKAIYQKEAKAIDKIQKGILSIVQEEEPYDIFICYKETDENGKRTKDSVIANDIYYKLTEEGYKVFYAAITLEDKLGQEYEPYIFAALNSAKIMLAVGTKPEYFSAPWVKNEWSRYLKIMSTDKKRLLIPCYRDMDAYDLPEEFAHLQAQDMGKIGFIEDIIRGIKKIIKKDTEKVVVKETVVVKEPVTLSSQTGAQGGMTAPNTLSLLKRAKMFLGDGNFESADDYAEKVLDIDPECADAYVVKLCCELKLKKEEQLLEYNKPFGCNAHYVKAATFATGERLAQIQNYYVSVMDRLYNGIQKKMERAEEAVEYRRLANEWDKLEGYKDSKRLSQRCQDMAREIITREAEAEYKLAQKEAEKGTAQGYRNAIEMMEKFPSWKESEQIIDDWRKKEKEAREREEDNENIYNRACSLMRGASRRGYKEAIGLFSLISNYKDSAERTESCKEELAKKTRKTIIWCIVGAIIVAMAIISELM